MITYMYSIPKVWSILIILEKQSANLSFGGRRNEVVGMVRIGHSCPAESAFATKAI
jgi:hypothetical protein